MTDKIHEAFHLDIDGVRQALESLPTAVGDGLSDTYQELWDIATEPDSVFARRRVHTYEERLASLSDLRRAKVLRRLGILSYADTTIQSYLGMPYNAPELEEVYRSALDQIAHAYDIEPEEIAARKKILQDDYYSRPWFYRYCN